MTEEEVMKLVFLFRVTDKDMAYKIREELYTFIQENSELKKRYCGKSIQKLWNHIHPLGRTEEKIMEEKRREQMNDELKLAKRPDINCPDCDGVLRWDPEAGEYYHIESLEKLARCR